ncbi:MAG: hypothetical protein A2934_03795 [Candidatus Sungbacteria bacterium RIFCSPLOWO2_01_FULL_47_10]|uniref:HTH arsR-type domain-containing protein n=1 Tax=Candidatus Sungbacteria bacterium RIFCSPLOWO2_01_FULL_47_10 TaxID=1802276 RepID=A0A1G2L542_9BACT|nr:MAG: hypothetical protein A2934_03795 [Candidatus Sungbacteria bacterium RIFCSPLOWO2_01_FULL_47_10]
MNEKELEKVFKACANKRRIAIIRYLKKEESAPVGEIASAIHLSFRSTSRHLRVLASSGILESEQKGLTIRYGISSARGRIINTIISLL